MWRVDALRSVNFGWGVDVHGNVSRCGMSRCKGCLVVERLAFVVGRFRLAFSRPASRMRVPEHYQNRRRRGWLSNNFCKRLVCAITRIVRGIAIVYERV